MADIELNYSIEVGLGRKNKGSRMTRYEVTEGINRIESVEAQLNISLEGMFAVMEGPDDGTLRRLAKESGVFVLEN